MKRIQIDENIHQFLVSRAVDIGESASSILRRELRLAPPAGTIEVDDDVYAFLVSRMVAIGESASSILRRELHLDAGPQPEPEPEPGQGARTVEFRIPAGTSNRPWNTAENAVVATVGDTLRVVNDDTVAHRLHTRGTPFPHPAADIPPGQSAEFLLAAPFSPGADGPLSDHLFGLGAQFWIEVRAAH